MKIPVSVNQQLPVVRVGEISSEDERSSLAGGGTLGRQVGRRDRWCPEMLRRLGWDWISP